MLFVVLVDVIHQIYPGSCVAIHMFHIGNSDSRAAIVRSGPEQIKLQIPVHELIVRDPFYQVLHDNHSCIAIRTLIRHDIPDKSYRLCNKSSCGDRSQFLYSGCPAKAPGEIQAA